MRGDIFIDSNTFLYANDQFDAAKRDVAQAWLSELTYTDQGVTNLQVLNEVMNVLLKKPERFGGGNPYEKVDVISDFGTTPLSHHAMLAARAVRDNTGYSWWDCLLLASALELGCTHFLSEDLQDRQRIEAGGKALTIVSPFAHTPDKILSLQG